MDILNKKKFILLRSASRRGVWACLKQLYVTLEDILVMRRHLVFSMKSSEFTAPPAESALICSEIQDWNDLPAALRKRLVSEYEALEWGDRGWFNLGRRLWMATLDGQVCGLCWLLDQPREEDFFCPVPENVDIVFQTVVLPEFRGQSIQIRLYRHLIRDRIQEGTRIFYISCHAYNHTSRRNIEKLGFRLIGHRRDCRFGTRRSWHPSMI